MAYSVLIVLVVYCNVVVGSENDYTFVDIFLILIISVSIDRLLTVDYSQAGPLQLPIYPAIL